ncbi:chromosome partitioning protein ParA [Pseudoalteromonas aurantia]|uniref:Chromosome partitioning protein ParA n=2 Tax=Pseudoalteromonas TaxID=53246 RepID=A0A5S3UZP9_9GAMM|nr:chromosome partitioning protein ParA [Pseudoalteromonas aurantia]TMO63047.1 chromosome partitioning protein ParA [Pseudoalteromonas aurantia]TMO63516.1 chromosome partitioning protein ParA [Pseudoalteromonas aurantia]TMO75397.1 chromosome partitioning protein ParA [Pseudoalteromonas aurantia]
MPSLQLPITVYQYLAINFGLLILAIWFYILLLILREFRKFASSVSAGTHTASSAQNDETLAMCRESVDNALGYINEHSNTIAELAKIQIALEQQLTDIRNSTQDHITKQEDQSIKDLNKKLLKSHALIRKLQGDLDKSMDKLKVTRKKLYDQYDTVESLQKEKKELEEKCLALENENGQANSSPQQMQRMVLTFEREKADMLDTLNNYKRQISEQSQALEQLSLQASNTENGPELSELQGELEQTKLALKHLTKEKKFIESRYLEIVKTQQDKSS